MATKEQIIADVKRIGPEICAVNAVDVDKNARFPIESLDALKAAGVLSAGVPVALGGAGMDIVEQGKLCHILGKYCSSSSMILGMHFIQVSSIVYFGKGNEGFENYLRLLADEQRLVASVTSETGIGGDLRKSFATIEREGNTFGLTKISPTLSYGAYAEDLVITCRKDKDSAASDQAFVLAIGDDFELEQNGIWDPMGMRGTCSPGFDVFVKSAETWQIFQQDFSQIAARTLVPDTHIIWAYTWLGIASNAAARARKLVQAAARKNPSQLPNNARDLAELEIHLERFKDTVKSVGERYLIAHQNDDSDYITSIAFSLKINTLKLNASQLVADICMRAMAICGFAGYLNNSPFSVARHLRDSLSAAPMVGNGRIIETNATNLLVYKGD
jgi:acyl-CoA dehydrogenase